MSAIAFQTLADFFREALRPEPQAASHAAVRLLQQLRQPGAYPWIEPDGRHVVLVFDASNTTVPDLRGEPAVLLTTSHLQWATRKDKGCLPLIEVPGTRLHVRRLPLPDAARVLYKFLVADRLFEVEDPKARNGLYSQVRITDRLVVDPLNPHRSFNGQGPHSVVEMPAFREPDMLAHRPPLEAIPETRRPSFSLAHPSGKPREIRVYLPPNLHDGQPLPLALVHDGNVYGNRLCAIESTFEHLITAGRIPPIMAVLVPHGDREQELRTHDAHAQWLMNDVLPEVRRRWPVATGPVHGNIGVSYGALFSWWLSGMYPDTFGWAVCHAGAFSGPAMRSLLERTLSGELRYPGRYFLDCGTFDEHLPHVQMLHAALENLSVQHHFELYDEGHEWTAWVARDADALPYVLSPSVERA